MKKWKRKSRKKKAKRKHIDFDPVVMGNDWKNDPGELATRIWEWWRVQVHDVENPKLMFFAHAIKLVVLTQLSSCAVERVLIANILIKPLSKNALYFFVAFIIYK